MAEPIRRDYAVAVIGLGGIGSGAAYWLSRRLGADVLGLEQFELGHVRGASQDHSRIIRLSYHQPDYVRLAKRAYETWDVLQAEAGVQVLTITGGLDLWPAGARIPMADYADSLAAEAVPFETLDATETMRRWPQWRLADDTVAIYQPAGGLADPSRANAAHQRLAREHGATLLERTPVTALRDRGGAIEIETDPRKCVHELSARTRAALVHSGQSFTAHGPKGSVLVATTPTPSSAFKSINAPLCPK